MGETFDCCSCGACCVEAGAVPVYADETRVPRRWTRSVRGRIGFASDEADFGGRPEGFVTHWMDLPEPPTPTASPLPSGGEA